MFGMSYCGFGCIIGRVRPDKLVWLLAMGPDPSDGIQRWAMFV